MDGLSPVQLNVATVGASQLTSPQSWRARRHPAMDAAAKALGMSASDLRTALQGGQSLASIASSKGIGQATLVAAMATAIQQANPNISADQASKVATAIATRTPPAGPQANPAGGSADPAQAATGTAAAGGRHHHHGHHAMGAAMDAAAKTLGITASDLTTALQNGQSLASLASSKGVSQDDLVKAISSALTQADTNLSTDQATQMATALVTGTPPSGQGQPWANGAGGTSSTFNVLA